MIVSKGPGSHVQRCEGEMGSEGEFKLLKLLLLPLPVGMLHLGTIHLFLNCIIIHVLCKAFKTVEK